MNATVHYAASQIKALPETGLKYFIQISIKSLNAFTKNIGGKLGLLGSSDAGVL